MHGSFSQVAEPRHNPFRIQPIQIDDGYSGLRTRLNSLNSEKFPERPGQKWLAGLGPTCRGGSPGVRRIFFSLLPCLISPTRQKQPKHARDQAPGNASSAIRPIVSSRRMWVNPILPQIHGIICRACPWRVRIWNSKASPLIYPNHCGGGLAIASFFGGSALEFLSSILVVKSHCA